MRIAQSALLSGVLGLLVTTGAAAQISAYHDATSSTHQSKFNSLTAAGYRPITLTVHGTTSSPRYSAVWAKRSGPAFTAFHDLPLANYQSYYNTWTAKGYKPEIISVYSGGPSPVVAGMFVKTSASVASWHGMTESTFRSKCAWAQDNGYIPTCVSIYGAASSTRYVAIFKKNTAKVRWNYGIDANATSYQKRYDAYAKTGVRPVLVGCNNPGRYVSVWQDTKLSSGFITRHGMTTSSYQSYFNSYAASGYYPMWLEGSWGGSATKLSAIWVKNESVKSRVWQVRGTAVSALAGFDTWMKNFMQDNAIRAGGLAVVRDGRLKLARGYTWAESGYPITQPTSTFRIASMSKPITSIAAHRAAIDNKLSLLDYAYTKLPSTTFMDSRNKQVRLLHLLSHTGGWNIDTLGFDPVFHDAQIAAKLGVSLPITNTQIWLYMSQYQNLQASPGTAAKYSNYGFSNLGRLLAGVYGYSYENVVKINVLGPLGLSRPFLGRSLVTERKAGEVHYHPRIPCVATTVRSGSGAWVPQQYGGWSQENMNANGGWVMAPADYAKILASFDVGDANPVLPENVANSMWSAPYPNVTGALRGWFRRTVKDESNITRSAYNHNGSLPGTATLGFRRSDGLSVVVFFNADLDGFLGGSHIDQLNAIANGVGSWPGHDLFPSVGIPTLGRWTLFGTSCPTSESQPGHVGLGSPIAGHVIDLEVRNAKPAKVGVLYLGLSNTGWNRTRLPLSLSLYGAPGCWLRVSPNLAFGRLISSTRGTSTFQAQIPPLSVLRGARLYSQYLLYDPKANALGLAATNGVEMRIGG